MLSFVSGSTATSLIMTNVAQKMLTFFFNYFECFARCRQVSRASGNSSSRKRPRNISEEGDAHFLEDELVQDEEDRKRLASMTEFEREMELAERAEKIQAERQRQQVLRAAELAEEDRRASRRSGREMREEAAKKSAMEELRAARQRKATGGTSKSRRDHSEEESDEAGGEYELEVSDVSEQEEEEEYYDEYDRRKSSLWHPKEHMDAADLEDADFTEVKAIQVRRHKLEEWFGKPFFDATLPGSIVRLASGDRTEADGSIVPLYFLAQVVAVEERPPGIHKYMPIPGAPGWKTPYRFGVEGFKTSKWLRVVRGRSDRYWPLAQVSNGSMTEEEFEKWQRVCEAEGRQQLTRGETEEVRKKLIGADNYVYTAEDVAKLVQEKRTLGIAPRNLAMERARLERERDVAIEAGDIEAAKAIEEDIEKLEFKRLSGTDRSLSVSGKGKLADINKRNATHNFNVAIKASSAGLRATSKGTTGDSTLDPFSRRITRPMVYWNTAGSSQANENSEILHEEIDTKNIEEETKASQENKQGNLDEDVHHQPTSTMIDLSALDLSVLHGRPKVLPLVRKLLGDVRMMSDNTNNTKTSLDGIPSGSTAITWSEYQQQLRS